MRYYDTVDYKFDKKKNSWVTKFFPQRVRGTKPSEDIIDAKTGKVIAEAGAKVTPRTVKKLLEEGKVTEIRVAFDTIVGRYVSQDIINEETGAIYVEAGDELTLEYDKDGAVNGGTLQELLEAGVTNIPTLDIDNVNVGQCWSIYQKYYVH